MKKTTPALIATSLISLFLAGGMFMIGLDATRTSASAATVGTAAVSQGIINAHTVPNWSSTITLQSVPIASEQSRTLLRTSGS